MTANTLYLVCSHHPTSFDSIALGTRKSNGYEHCPLPRDLEKWFEKHKHCGASHDHFTVAFDKPKDWDIPIDKPVANAVHLTLVGQHS